MAGYIGNKSSVTLVDGYNEAEADAEFVTKTGDSMTGGLTITTADNTNQLSIVSTDADANSGPVQVFYRNSGSPADSDLLGEIHFRGRNDNSQDVEYVTLSTRMEDVSDGTEDGKIILKTMVAGTARSRIEIDHTDVVINQDSIDSNLRVESDNLTHALFVQGSDGKVGIGTSSPSRNLTVSSSGQTDLAIIAASGSSAQLCFGDGDDDNVGQIEYSHPTDSMRFYTQGAERCRIDSSGNVLVGTTDDAPANNSANGTADNGFVVKSDGVFQVAKYNDTPAYINRTGSDGILIDLRKSGATVGSIGNGSSTSIYIAGNTQANSNLGFGGSSLIYPTIDNVSDVGAGGLRFDDIFATNGTIQTSDFNEKQDIASLTATEMLVGKRISTLFKTFRWKDSVAEKGENARTHTGVIAQDVQAAFTAEGLDAGDYALFISSTWWETQTEVPAVEAVAEVTDEDGNVTTEAVEAKDAYTRTDTYETEDEAPEGSTSKTRLGIRYPELLSFVAAYNEQRFASIEARLTALEA